MKTTKKPVIGIIGGNGKMGQWFTKFFEESGHKVLVSGRKTKLTTLGLVKKSDIIVLSVPIAQTLEVIQNVLPYLKKDQLLTDLTSFKVMSMEAIKESSSGTLGMHPLFGPSATLEIGLKIVFCKQKDNMHVAYLRDLFLKKGIEIIDISPEEHDYQMAYIQAFTHAVNLLYAKIIFEHKNVLTNKLCTPIFTLQSLIMGRVLHQDMQLIMDMQFYNPYFVPVLEAFIEQAKKLESILEKQDAIAFTKMFGQEQELAKNFASFSTQQTNKLLANVNQVALAIPSKKTRTMLPKDAVVGYLGPEGTFSHQATITIAPSGAKKNPFATLFDVFNALQNGDLDLAVVPAENSIEGTVRETLDYLVDFSLIVLGSFSFPIHQQLVSLEKNIHAITTIASHPQALAQCKQWINRNIPKASLFPTPSTTASLVNPQKKYGYIASDLAAKKYNLHILAKNIEDNPGNLTKFYLIAKEKIHLQNIKNEKTLVFLAVHNKVGILRDILNVFANHEINLTKLESRPSGEKMGDYHFFIEFEKSKNNTPLAKTFEALKPFCPIIRVLGKT